MARPQKKACHCHRVSDKHSISDLVGVIPQLEQWGDLVMMMTMAMILIMNNDDDDDDGDGDDDDDDDEKRR